MMRALAVSMSFLRACAGAALIAMTSACATGLGAGEYPRSEVGRPMRLEYGVVERIRPVRIEGTRTIVGPAVGAAVGGIAGSEIGGGDEESAIAAIAGAVLGGLAGAAIEEGVTRREGTAYTIRLNTGDLVNIVQAGPAVAYPGQSVTIEYGERARVLPR